MTDLENGADLRERFERALADADAPDGLAAAALTRGHTLRRRRRTLVAGAGLATAAVVAALVVPGMDSGPEGTASRFATQPTTQPSTQPSPTPDPMTPSPGPTGGNPFSDLPEGWWDAPATRLLDQLRDALPDGVEIVGHELAPEDRAPGEPDVASGWVSVTLESAGGAGGFEVILSMPDLEKVPDPVTTTDAAGNEGIAVLAQGPSNRSRVTCGHQSRYTDTCEEILDADGAPVGRLTTVLQDDTITFYEATLLGPEGGLVYLSAWNATDVKPGPDTEPSAPEPPLTLDQMHALVEDPAWTSYVPQP